MAFWSDSLQQLSEIAVTFQLQTRRDSARPASIKCSFILLHTRTSRLGLSRFRNDRLWSSTIRKERSHENVTSNHARERTGPTSSADREPGTCCSYLQHASHGSGADAQGLACYQPADRTGHRPAVVRWSHHQCQQVFGRRGVRGWPCRL